jgi:hypothetical protein
MTTNVGKWTFWYEGTEQPWPYGDTTSYEIGAAWLAGCARVEDWGCGAGWLSTLIPADRYRGIDGDPFATLRRSGGSRPVSEQRPRDFHAPHP